MLHKWLVSFCGHDCRLPAPAGFDMATGAATVKQSQKYFVLKMRFAVQGLSVKMRA